MATAREPSSWRSKTRQLLLLFGDDSVGRCGRRRVAVCERPGETLLDRANDGVERYHAAQRRQAAEEHGVRHRPTEVLQGELCGGNNRQAVPAHTLGELAEAQLVETVSRVDEEIARSEEHTSELQSPMY